MEYTYLNPATLVENLIEKVLPSLTTEELTQKSYAFRERNWTSQGTYAYVKYSNFTKSQQDEMRDLLKSKEKGKFFDDIYPEYESLLWNEITTEWDLTEELQGVEEESDEYYEIIQDCIESTTEINSPHFHFMLACIELMEEYASNVFHDEFQQVGIDELVEEMGLTDDGGYIYNEEDEDNGVSYVIDFDYDKMENVIYDVDSEVITLDELKKRLEKLQVNLVD